MNKPIFDPNFWSERVRENPEEIHRAVRYCSIDQRAGYEVKANALLHQIIQPHDSILDVGCGPGLLLNIMPAHWRGYYLGVDICPEFIRKAQMEHDRTFLRVDAREIPSILSERESVGLRGRFDVAVCFDFARMVKDNMGEDVWNRIKTGLLERCSKVLVMEPTVVEGQWELHHEIF